ncbi:MAG: hypothetical protein R2741_14610, partial [Methanolobus sp.]
MEEAILELRTKIPKEKLVYSICEFYRRMGHRKIKLISKSEDNIISEDYTSSDEIETAGNLS